jgi:hypothetical protein
LEYPLLNIQAHLQDSDVLAGHVCNRAAQDAVGPVAQPYIHLGVEQRVAVRILNVHQAACSQYKQSMSMVAIL